ncbi:MAG: hypothetical protein A2X86_10445 [Bdellovibrionales bacterium GWA2_49_15]|nr:MAG: hypothetical protein A2X86_10445 [Bdellovibrionales bacterium GWA2_49_15]HAZ14748.1 hypothetical protein [Bdellovibrionales bacterium]
MHLSLKGGLLFLALTMTAAFGDSLPKQFPDDNVVYRPGHDVGMSPYLAKSLYGTNKLALTYDDGPHAVRTPKMLDLLKEFDVKATFFVLTSQINETTRPIIERIVNEGHQLASHDKDHDDNNGENEATYKAELKASVVTIEGVLAEMGVHQREMFYRFPYGAYGKAPSYHHLNIMKQASQELYGDNCINFVFWDIDTSDWLPVITPQEVAQNVRSHMEGGTAYTFKAATVDGRRVWTKVPYRINNPSKGGVVLMHDIQEKTLAATRLILTEAKAKGWQIVPLNVAKEFDYGNKECVLK